MNTPIGVRLFLVSIAILTAYCGQIKQVTEKKTPEQNKEESTLSQLKVNDSPNCKNKKYYREHWKHWVDENGDCHDTRQEVLISRSVQSVSYKEGGCKVEKGKWTDPYDAEEFTQPSELDIDHMVPLKNAHESGGCDWDSEKKKGYANFLGNSYHLMPVKSSENRSKSDKSPDQWKPSNKDYYCTYAKNWISIKKDWGLSITNKEKTALEDMLSECKAQ